MLERYHTSYTAYTVLGCANSYTESRAKSLPIARCIIYYSVPVDCVCDVIGEIFSHGARIYGILGEHSEEWQSGRMRRS